MNATRLLLGGRIHSPAMPDATAAAAPPLEPPADSAPSRGLRVGPKASGSVVKLSPSSAELVLPKMTSPAAL